MLPLNCSPETIEQLLRKQGIIRIAGVDEAGRGPLAGPVIAACCIMPCDLLFPKVCDSKLLSEKERESIFEDLTNHPHVVWQVAAVGPEVIDSINIRQATLLAMKLALEKLDIPPEYVLIDGRDTLDLAIPQQAVVKGDLHVKSIGAASIIAKVYRDRLMRELAKQFPVYGFERHKGYPTAGHIQAIVHHGICKQHRISYAPINRLFA